MAIQRKLVKTDQANMTIEQAYYKYISAKIAVNASKDTIRSTNDSFKRWFKYLDEEGYKTDIKDVEEHYVSKFSSHFIKREKMKPVTLNHYLRHIRAFLYWCMDQGFVPEFKIKLVKEQESVIETYSEDELLLLLRRPSKNDSFTEWRSWTIINWILATGNRASTICNVQIRDVDFVSSEIAIRFSKNNNAMFLPMSLALKTALREYVDLWRSGSAPGAYLFPNVGDEKLSVNALKLSIRRYNESRDVDKTSIHMFRHTFAKHWIRNKGDVFRLQKLLDHSTLEMTKKYVTMFSEDLKENYDEFSPLDVIKKKSSRTHRVSRTQK